MSRRNSLAHCAALCALLAAGAGCSGDQASDIESSAPAKSFGVVHLQHVGELDAVAQEGRAPQPETPRAAQHEQALTATAYFVRHRATSARRLSALLALPLDPDGDLPSGTDVCEIYDTHAALTEGEVTGASETYVDLLEGGEIALTTQAATAQGTRLKLVPAYFAGLIPHISGAVYGEAQADGAAAPRGVVAASRGSDTVGAFRADVTSPSPWLMKMQADRPLKQGVALSWRRAVGIVRADVAYVVVRPSDPSSERTLRCKVRDDGAFRISPQHLAAIAQENPTDSDRYLIEAGRMRIYPIRGTGLDQAELRINTAQRAELRIH